MNVNVKDFSHPKMKMSSSCVHKGVNRPSGSGKRQAAAAVAPMLVDGDASHDAWKGSQTHSQNLPLDPAARSVHTLKFPFESFFQGKLSSMARERHQPR